MQFGPKGDKQSIGLIKLQAQRAIDWFDEKKLLNDLSSYDTNMMNRQIFIDKGAGISKFLDYSDNGNFKNVLGFFGGKKGLYVKDESSFNEEDMDALKKYISSGGHIYFETFSFYSLTVGEENEVDLFSKVLQETIDAQKEFNAND